MNISCCGVRIFTTYKLGVLTAPINLTDLNPGLYLARCSQFSVPGADLINGIITEYNVIFIEYLGIIIDQKICQNFFL